MQIYTPITREDIDLIAACKAWGRNASNSQVNRRTFLEEKILSENRDFAAMPPAGGIDQVRVLDGLKMVRATSDDFKDKLKYGVKNKFKSLTYFLDYSEHHAKEVKDILQAYHDDKKDMLRDLFYTLLEEQLATGESFYKLFKRRQPGTENHQKLIHLLNLLDIDEEFIISMNKSDMDMINFLLINFTDKIPKFLKEAIQNNKIEVVKKLIDAGANLNIQDSRAKTALMYSVHNGNDNNEVSEKLIDAGADLNIKNIMGQTALMYSAGNGNNEVSEKLIDAGADLNIQDKNGQTALMYAIGYGKDQVAKKLIDAGTDLNIQDKYGKTALMYAVEKGRAEVFKKLIQDGVQDLNVTVSDKSLFLVALKNNHFDIAHWILENKLEGRYSSIDIDEITERYKLMGGVGFDSKFEDHNDDANLIFQGMFERVQSSMERESQSCMPFIFTKIWNKRASVKTLDSFIFPVGGHAEQKMEEDDDYSVEESNSDYEEHKEYEEYKFDA